MWREKGWFRATEPTGRRHVVLIEVEDDAALPTGGRSVGVEVSRQYITTEGLLVYRISKGSYRFSNDWTPLGSDDPAAPRAVQLAPIGEPQRTGRSIRRA